MVIDEVLFSYSLLVLLWTCGFTCYRWFYVLQSVTVMILSLVQIFPSLVSGSPFILNPVSFWQNYLSSKVTLFSGLANVSRPSSHAFLALELYVAQSCPTLCNSMDCSQAPWSMEFSRQECWSGLPFSSPGDLPDPGIKSGTPELQADSLPSEPPGKSRN